MSYNFDLLQKNTSHIIITPEKIKTLGTVSLLRIYKTLHSYTTHGGTCDCCGESNTHLYGQDEDMKLSNDVDENFEIYRQAIKAELNTREHVPKGKQSKPNPNRDLVLLRKRIKRHGYYNLSEDKIREMYNEQASYFARDPYGFKGFRLTQILDLVKAIKHSKNNQAGK